MAKLTEPLPSIHRQNLSYAWGDLLCAMYAASGGERGPVTVCIDGFDDNNCVEEDPEIRSAIDALLEAKEQTSIGIVAFTIFPQRIWKIAQGDRQLFYDLYKYSFVSFRKNRLNRKGLYFQRLVMFDADDKNSPNQLEYIINRYNDKKANGGKAGPPRIHLMASIHNPRIDHTHDQVPSFPCMQQISFCPTDKGLVVNANYATQQVVRKAYGNFLGLAHLAKFMADEMGLQLAQLNIMVGVEKIGDSRFPKSSLRDIVNLIKSKVPNGT